MTSSTRFVGLGSMGSGMVRNLLKNGFAVTVDDLSPERVAAVVADGATAGAPGPITESVVRSRFPAPQRSRPSVLESMACLAACSQARS